MRFIELDVDGAFRIELEPHHDERGFFARVFCEDEFRAVGLPVRFPQSSLSISHHRGTLRGLHFRADGREAKHIQCIAGAVFDVVADVRRGSPTYGKWDAVELTAENHQAIYVPPGCAHGHLTLTDEAELLYRMSASYAPDQERGVRWNDPDLAIEWPFEPTQISSRDEALPFLAALPEPAVGWAG